MKPDEMLLWIKALQDVLCEAVNAEPFGGERQEFVVLWLDQVNAEWMKATSPKAASYLDTLSR